MGLKQASKQDKEMPDQTFDWQIAQKNIFIPKSNEANTRVKIWEIEISS